MQSIKGKLYWAFGSVIALLLIVVGVGMKTSLDLLREMQDTSRDNIQAAVQLANVQSAMWQLRWNMAQFIAVQGDERAKIVAGESKTIQAMVENFAAYEKGNR